MKNQIRNERRLLCILLMLILVTATACANHTLANEAVPIVDTGVDPDAWVTIPAGEFLSGQHEHPAMIEDDYEMMATLVTNEQYEEFVNAALDSSDVRIVDGAVVAFYPGDPFHGQRHEKEIAAGDKPLMPVEAPGLRLRFDGAAFAVEQGYENHPATMVSWFGAYAYCRYYDWRLPTDLEWEKAARGTDNRPYPWGHEPTDARANFLDSQDPFEGSSETTPVGFYNGNVYEGYATQDGTSPYGIYDMAGNVWKWTGEDHWGSHDRSLRGGSYANYPYNLRIWSHNAADPSHMSPRVGFRCVRDIRGTP